ncbi:MAG: hypothetical protein AAFX03_07585 [Pseudomonadota bacterium]
MVFSLSILAGIMTVITAPGLIAAHLENRKAARDAAAGDEA